MVLSRTPTAYLADLCMVNEVETVRRLKEIVEMRWREALLGSITFWLPDVLHHYFTRSEPTMSARWILTLVMPSVATAAYFLAKRNVARHASRAWSMLLGIWCLGPMMIGLGQTFEGAGFRSSIWNVPLCIVAGVFPPLTLVLAGFDLSVFALLLATLSLLLIYRFVERPGRQTRGQVAQPLS